MTDEEKKECRETMYTKDHMGDFKACDGDCDKCELSYDYVTGYNDFKEEIATGGYITKDIKETIDLEHRDYFG